MFFVILHGSVEEHYGMKWIPWINKYFIYLVVLLFLLLLVSKLNCCFLRATVNIDDPSKIFEQSKNNANNILVTTLIIEAAYARTIIKSLPHWSFKKANYPSHIGDIDFIQNTYLPFQKFCLKNMQMFSQSF